MNIIGIKSENLFVANVVCQVEPVSVQKHDPETDTTVDVFAEYLNDIDTVTEVSDATSTVQLVGSEEALRIARSARIGEVDLLEQIIEDAKNNKVTICLLYYLLAYHQAINLLVAAENSLLSYGISCEHHEGS